MRKNREWNELVGFQGVWSKREEKKTRGKAHAMESSARCSLTLELLHYLLYVILGDHA